MVRVRHMLKLLQLRIQAIHAKNKIKRFYHKYTDWELVFFKYAKHSALSTLEDEYQNILAQIDKIS